MEISVCIFSTIPEQAELQQRFIAAVLFQADYRAKILSCSTDAALRKATAPPISVDLLFLPATAFGIAFGEEFRRVNRSTTIVFLAQDDSHVYRAFHALPIAYLVDHKDRRRLSETILRAASWAISGKKTFRHESRTQLLQIRFRDIDYFESEYRIVHIHKTDGTHETITAKLDDVEGLLPPGAFCRCHKSYLVNLENIASVNKSDKTVLFKSGAHVFSSKAQYPTLIASLKGDGGCESV